MYSGHAFDILYLTHSGGVATIALLQLFQFLFVAHHYYLVAYLKLQDNSRKINTSHANIDHNCNLYTNDLRNNHNFGTIRFTMWKMYCQMWYYNNFPSFYRSVSYSIVTSFIASSGSQDEDDEASEASNNIDSSAAPF